MKKFFGYFIFTFIMIFGLQSVVLADADHHFSFKAYNCNALDANWETCVDDNGDELPLVELADNAMINPGDFLRLDVYYEPSTTNPDVMMTVGFTYNPDAVQPFKDGGEIYTLPLQTTYFGGIYPAMGSRPNQQGRTNWHILSNDVVDLHQVMLLIEDQTTNDAITTNGVLATMYFEVKDTATPGDIVDFVFTPEDTLMANKSGTNLTDKSLMVYKTLDADTTLKSLSVKNGTTEYLLQPFSSSTKTYNVFVPNDISTVTIDAETTKATSSVIIPAVSTLPVGEAEEVSLLVTAENGDTDTYTVNVYRLNNNANLSSLALSNVDIGTFDKNTLTYNANVPYKTASTTVTATPEDANATVAGTGNQNLGVGVTPIVIEVSPENCKAEYNSVPGNTCIKQTYTVNVTRAPPATNAKLSDLKVDGTTVTGFDPDTKSYTLANAKGSKASIDITATPADANATVSGDGTQNLQVGDNSFDITVTAEDGTTQETYTINIYKENNDATLSSLTVTSDPAGSLDKTFDPNVTTYTYTADPDETEVTIAATATDSANATVAGEGTYNPKNTSSINITVTAEDGTTKIYTVNLVNAKSTNAKLSDLKVDGTTVTNFDPDTFTYNLTVASNVDSATIASTLADERASKTGDGTKSLNYGNNSFDITVTAEDGTTTQTYTVNITREKKTNANLSDLKVDGTTVTNFDPDTTSYTLANARAGKDSISITATPEDSDATVSGDGSKNLQVGENSFDITVTAQDGTTQKTYTVNITKENNDATLSALNVTSDPVGSLDKAFNPNTTTYTYTAAADETEVVITATATDSANATVTGDGTYNPQNTSSVEITVTAQDGTIKVYTVNLALATSTNAKLSDLKVDGTTVEGFNKNTNSYVLDAVPNDKTSISITATPEDANATISGDGNKELQVGNNSFDITVTAADGVTQETYTINVTREAAPLSDNAKLSDLKVDGTTVTGFDPDTFTYNLDPVSNDKTSISITATPADANATVSGDGSKNLQVGDNSFDIIVTAEDGTTTETYTINITREAAPVLSDNAKLSDLKVDGTTVTGFDPDTFTYNLDPVSNDKTSISITATPADANATVSGDGSKNLQVGDNSFDITVTAQDGTTTQTYKVNITREAAPLSDNNYLSSLSVEGYTISPEFNKETDRYSLTIPAAVNSINVSATPEDNSADVDGTGTIEITESKTISITVTAESGSIRVYSLVVTKEGDTPSEDEITSHEYGHIIENDMIKTVAYKTKPNDLKDQLDNPNEHLFIRDKDDSEDVSNDTNLATGMIVKLIINNEEKDSKYIVIKGDVDGNGQIALLDAVKVIGDYIDKTPLEGVWLEAGDYDSNEVSHY